MNVLKKSFGDLGSFLPTSPGQDNAAMAIAGAHTTCCGREHREHVAMHRNVEAAAIPLSGGGHELWL